MTEKKNQRRVYVVRHKHTKVSRLIRSPNQAQAFKHINESDYDCHVASQDDCIRLVGEGVQVEDAGGAE